MHTSTRLWIASTDDLDYRRQLRAGRINAETAPALVAPDRVTALVGLHEARTAALLADTRAKTVLPSQRPATRRRLRLALLAGGAALVAVAPWLWPASPSHALAVPVRTPVVVTVSGPSARITTDVVSTAPETRDGGHAVWLAVGGVTLVGVAARPSRGPALVHLSGVVPSRALTPGVTGATLIDVGDYSMTPLPLKVLRASRVDLDRVIPLPGGVMVLGRARHYDIPTGTYRGDASSPVWVQVLSAGRWVTVATPVTADASGSVAALVPAPVGPLAVRLVRPAGATVTGGASRPGRAFVAFPDASGRGDY